MLTPELKKQVEATNKECAKQIMKDHVSYVPFDPYFVSKLCRIALASEGLVEALEAKEELLVCYRVGKNPSEKLWRKLEKASKSIEVFRAGMGEKE